MRSKLISRGDKANMTRSSRVQNSTRMNQETETGSAREHIDVALAVAHISMEHHICRRAEHVPPRSEKPHAVQRLCTAECLVVSILQQQPGECDVPECALSYRQQHSDAQNDQLKDMTISLSSLSHRRKAAMEMSGRRARHSARHRLIGAIGNQEPYLLPVEEERQLRVDGHLAEHAAGRKHEARCRRTD